MRYKSIFKSCPFLCFSNIAALFVCFFLISEVVFYLTSCVFLQNSLINLIFSPYSLEFLRFLSRLTFCFYKLITNNLFFHQILLNVISWSMTIYPTSSLLRIILILKFWSMYLPVLKTCFYLFLFVGLLALSNSQQTLYYSKLYQNFFFSNLIWKVLYCRIP